MNFGEAIEALKAGERVARSGWNGEGMWLTFVPAWHYNPSNQNSPTGIEKVPWIGLKTGDNKFVPWLPSQTDLLAGDWKIVN